MRLIPTATRPRLLLGGTVALLAVLAGTLAAVLPGGGADASHTSAATDTVWPLYSETVAIRPPAYDSPLNLSVRNTETGLERAALRPPDPDESTGFVLGTGHPGRWLVGVQRWQPTGYDNSAQPAQLYLATDNPEAIDGNPVSDTRLAPLPVAPLRASQLIDGTAARSGVRQLAAATLSPDGRRLALVTTQGDRYQVSISTVTGKGAARTWSGQASPASALSAWGFTLTWLSDNKTLAVAMASGDTRAGRTATVSYLNTAAPGGSLRQSSRTVTLAFPARKQPGAPTACHGVPVATSDGQRVLCPGVAAPAGSTANGAATVGIWVFSARTGALTAAWNEHTICCTLASTEFPHIVWVSPHGQLLIADGMSTADQGARLYLRQADGTLRQLPWKGVTRPPGQTSPVEPSIAW